MSSGTFWSSSCSSLYWLCSLDCCSGSSYSSSRAPFRTLLWTCSGTPWLVSLHTGGNRWRGGWSVHESILSADQPLWKRGNRKFTFPNIWLLLSSGSVFNEGSFSKSSFHAKTKHFNGVELFPEKHLDWETVVLFSTLEPTTLLRSPLPKFTVLWRSQLKGSP